MQRKPVAWQERMLMIVEENNNHMAAILSYLYKETDVEIGDKKFAGKKITTRKLSRFGSDMKTDYGPQKHHTQGVTSRDAAQAQRRSEHKARRGVKTKGTVASDIKKSLKETYTVTNADKKGNTPAYQGYKAGKKNVKTGEPLYKAADHMKNESLEDAYLKVYEGKGEGFGEKPEASEKKGEKKEKPKKEKITQQQRDFARKTFGGFNRKFGK